jgi:hypothetical protein
MAASEAELELIETLQQPKAKSPRAKAKSQHAPMMSVTVRISQADHQALDAAAQARGLTAKILARKLLRTVLHDRLIDAVLDDGQ